MTVQKKDMILNQRCPTHSPLATCGEWPIKCGEWHKFQIVQKMGVFGKKCTLMYTFVLKMFKGLKRNGPGYNFFKGIN